MVLDRMALMGHEDVIFSSDPRAGYRAIIAIHSTALGPAVGGTRLWRYASEEDALVDALRLSRGMTYKNAVAGLPLGGGKAVILSEGEIRDREMLFRAHGRAVENLGGRFITGEDVGTSPADMEIVHRETNHVGGIAGRGGDPSPWTAEGVFQAIRAAARWRWGTDNLSGRTVALQGCGNVGFALAVKLHGAGARLIVADVDDRRVDRLVAATNAKRSTPESIYEAPADLFAPCALGGVLNDEIIPRLRAEIVAGAANNQLLEERHGDALAERKILYAPDYVANAGGVLTAGVAFLGWTEDELRARVLAIGDTMTRVFELATDRGISTDRAADSLAEERLRKGTQPR